MDLTDQIAKEVPINDLIELCHELGIGHVDDQYEPHILIDLIRVSENSSEQPLYKRIVQTEFFYELDHFEIPDCYEFPLDSDPACDYCLLYKNCVQDHLLILPPCYGILYDSTKECQNCQLSETCNVTIPESKVEVHYEIYLIQDIPLLSNMLKAFARFRHFYHSWPQEMILGKKNRYFGIRKHKVKQRGDSSNPRPIDEIRIDATIGEREIVTKRTPIQYTRQRKPILCKQTNIM